MIIFDLDGTLALDHHRSHFLKQETKDWDSYFAACGDDAPHLPILKVLSHLHGTDRIEIWTGRVDSTRHTTIEWLARHRLLSLIDNLRMREAEDRTEDTELKRQWLKQAQANGYKIDLVFEDRQRVVDMWRSEGIVCCQVAPGDF